MYLHLASTLYVITRWHMRCVLNMLTLTAYMNVQLPTQAYQHNAHTRHHGHIVNVGEPCEDCARTMRAPWDDRGMNVGGPWEDCGRTVGGPWEDRGRTVGGPWEDRGRTIGSQWSS